jgi:hypothetical protein
VALIHQNRTIDLTEPQEEVKVKTVPPQPVITAVSPQLIPQEGTSVKISYTGNEGRSATVLLYRTDLPGGPQLAKTFVTAWGANHTIWDGKIHERPAPAGTYLVGLQVTDAACNTARFPARIPPVAGSAPHIGVTVSYVSAVAPLVPVTAGTDAVVRVESPGGAYHWSLQRVGTGRAALSGSSPSSTLQVPVPGSRPGLYVLTLRSATGVATAPIVASAPRPASVLVVLPALTWQGLDPVDDTGDGLPSTLTAGGPISLERPLVDGLPAGFADEAGLLAELDSSHRSYDVTTDLGLIDGVGPPLAGHKAIVLAGSERWLPASVRSALRSFVLAGGRVLSLGVDSLRRGVTVDGATARGPTRPSSTDALGARLGPLATKGAAPVSVIRDDLGLFSGVSGLLAGFRSFQPVTPPAGAVASVAGPGAVVGYRLGRGIVIDLGVPGFGAALAHDAGARALIARLWTVVSR